MNILIDDQARLHTASSAKDVFKYSKSELVAYSVDKTTANIVVKMKKRAVVFRRPSLVKMEIMFIKF